MMNTNTQIAIAISGGFKVIDFSEILYCTADGSYTEIHLDNSEKIIVSKNLKVLEERFPKTMFLRIHHKYLVNRFQVCDILVNGQCLVVLKNGKKLEISLKKKLRVIGAFDKL